MVASAPSCVPGTAEVSLVPWTVDDSGSGGTGWATLLPVLKSGAPLVERAWLRRVRVLDWGDLDNLHFLKADEAAVKFLNAQIIGNTTLEVSSAVGIDNTISAYEVLLGSVIAADGINFTDSVSFPKLEIEWSCETSQNNPQYTVLSNNNHIYARKLKDLSTVKQVMGYNAGFVVRIDPLENQAEMFLRGRYAERLNFPIVESSPGSWSFDININRYSWNFQADGTMTESQSPDQLTINFTNLTIQGDEFGSPTWIMNRVGP